MWAHCGVPLPDLPQHREVGVRLETVPGWPTCDIEGLLPLLGSPERRGLCLKPLVVSGSSGQD